MRFIFPKYYFVSYAYEQGFGSVWFRFDEEFDIEKAREEILKGNPEAKKVVILNFMKVSRESYEKNT